MRAGRSAGATQTNRKEIWKPGIQEICMKNDFFRGFLASRFVLLAATVSLQRNLILKKLFRQAAEINRQRQSGSDQPVLPQSVKSA
jgi:hypothetical protein